MKKGNPMSRELKFIVTLFFPKIDHGSDSKSAREFRNAIWREAATHGKLLRHPA
jgi:hypothetical protein